MSLDDYRAAVALYLRLDIDASEARDIGKIEQVLQKHKKEKGLGLAMAIKTSTSEGLVHLPFCIGNVDQVINNLKKTGEINNSSIIYPV